MIVCCAWYVVYIKCIQSIVGLLRDYYYIFKNCHCHLFNIIWNILFYFIFSCKCRKVYCLFMFLILERKILLWNLYLSTKLVQKIFMAQMLLCINDIYWIYSLSYAFFIQEMASSLGEVYFVYEINFCKDPE